MSLQCLTSHITARRCITKFIQLFVIRNSNTNATELLKRSEDDLQVVLSNDESMYVVWHPKQDFPYECTRPLPEPKREENTSVLKTQMTDELKQIFKKKTPEQARQELMNITHTTKHRWFPRSRDKKAKKTPMDREYL